MTPTQTESEPSLTLDQLNTIIARVRTLYEEARALGLRTGWHVHYIPRSLFDQLPGTESILTGDHRTCWTKRVDDRVIVFCDQPPVPEHTQDEQEVAVDAEA